MLSRTIHVDVQVIDHVLDVPDFDLVLAVLAVGQTLIQIPAIVDPIVMFSLTPVVWAAAIEHSENVPLASAAGRRHSWPRLRRGAKNLGYLVHDGQSRVDLRCLAGVIRREAVCDA
jgi:hypothetical protein